MGDASAVLAEAVLIFREEQAEFMLVGATAFGFHTLPRATYDLDFLVGEDPAVLARLKRRFLVIEETEDPFFSQRALLLEVPTRVTPVEAFIATHWFTRQALSRRVDSPRAGAAGVLPVATPEDLLLLKAAVSVHPARPPGKRATDAADLGLLLDADPSLDRPYVESNARKLGDAVLSALKDAGWR